MKLVPGVESGMANEEAFKLIADYIENLVATIDCCEICKHYSEKMFKKELEGL
jgi:hypothetical protein